MDENNTPTQLHLFIKPVREYLINGPIPPEDLAYLDFVSSYLGMESLHTILVVHFMLEYVTVHGAPEWWKGSVAAFEEEFHDQYQRMIQSIQKESDIVWMAAQNEVNANRLAPLPEDATKEQVEVFLSQGLKRLQQTFAVELLLNMWLDARE